MGFQGDVAGLGLGELLQGLARGGREGVLTLRGAGKTARLGVESGQIFLLPEIDEDPHIWRKRCERAWAPDPEQRIDILRMAEIAYAARMEQMFELLDCEGVHFRFEPGPLPDPKAVPKMPKRADDGEVGRMETGGPLDAATPVHCAGISVEFLLLEYARLCDEMQSHPGAGALSENSIPYPLSPQCPSKGFTKLWPECDGVSNVGEIADRLGWPIRQTRASIYELLEQGHARVCDARELLDRCRRELAQNRLARAATRLAGWCEASQPGAPDPDDAEALLGEWERGKLPVVLANMQPRVARAFLRKLDLAANNVVSSVARWTEMRKYHRHDSLAELRLLHWQCRSTDEADAPSMTDLLRVSRKFQECGQRMHARAMLRAAGARGPETTAVRLELGQRMLSVGMLDEGVPWILEVGRTLIDSGAPDKAVVPLRAALDIAPNHRELRALFSVARNKSSSGKRTRRNSLVALSGVLVLVLAAVVKVRFDQAYDRSLDEIAEGAGTPADVLAKLESRFSDDHSPRVQTLREGLQQRVREDERAARDAWMTHYQEVGSECSLGDPMLGLKRALELPAPPTLVVETVANWPSRGTLLENLAARLEQTVAEWGEPDQQQGAAHAEQRLSRLIADLLGLAKDQPGEDVAEFAKRMQLVDTTLHGRDETRAKEREAAAKAEQLQQQDMLLAAARAHAQAGDLERAVQAYQRLAEVPGSEKLMELLGKETSKVQAHYRAVQLARELARRGQHAEALRELSAVCDDPSEHLLPCNIDSLPHGARVRLPDGSQRTTPFVLDIAPGEKLALEFDVTGCESEHIVIDDPADQMVLLSRKPERWWRTSASVEALPMSVDDEHIVCDRAGHMARMQGDTRLKWTLDIASLGGVARTPVFLPQRAGSVLVITEEGSVWIVDTADGHAEGPWAAGSPPVSGPLPTQKGASATFMNGTQANWLERLRPETTVAESARPTRDNGHEAGLAVLRRTASLARTLESPWGNWSVAITDTHFVVRKRGGDEIAFSVRRNGEWSYVAWEAPYAKLPRGRLWTSDGAGLRGFEP